VRALDAARVAADQPVIERGVEDGPEQPVRLGCGDLAHAGVEQFLTPATDTRHGDLTNRDVLEVRRDVGAEQAPVDQDRLWAQARTFIDP
jgi:hypothetical protein